MSIDQSGHCQILLTRPKTNVIQLIADIEALADPVQSSLKVVHEPMLEIEYLSNYDSSNVVQPIKSCLAADFVIFISTNAVLAFEHLLAKHALQKEGVNPRLQAVAIGRATEQALKENGWPVWKSQQPVATPRTNMIETSEALIGQLADADIRDKRITICKGEGGRDFLQQELERLGAQVDIFACYRRKSPLIDKAADSPALAEFFTQVGSKLSVVVVASGETLQNFINIVRQLGYDAYLDQLDVIVPSERVAKLAAEFGFAAVHLAVNASDAAVLRQLKAVLVNKR